MTKLLVQGAAILAADVVDAGDEIHSADAIYPKHVLDGWQIVDVDVPAGFAPAGYTWDGAAVVEKPPVVLPPAVPASVTRRQALQQLRIEGFTEDQIIDKINALPIPQLNKDLALIELKDSQIFERNRPLVAQMGAMLGKDSAGVDAMFIAAAKL